MKNYHLYIQYKVIVALIIKELRVRFGTRKLSYFWMFGEPVLHILPFFIIRSFIGNWKFSELIIFLLTGIVIVLFFINTVKKIKAAISANKALLMYHNINAFNIAVARSIIEFVISIIVFIVIFALLFLIFEEPIKLRAFPLFVAATILFVIFAFSWGIIFMVILQRLPFLDQLINFLLRITFFVSGAFFSVHDIPYKFREIILLNPIVHVVEIFRHNFMPDNVKYYGEIHYIMITTFYSLFIALFLYFLNKKKLI